MITINICSNYNTPSFGVSLKKLPTKKVLANDIAKKVLADIMNADTENRKVEAQIDSFEKYIKEIQDYKNEKGAELRKRYDMLKKYHQDLEPLTYCSEMPGGLYYTVKRYYRDHCRSNPENSFHDGFRWALREYLKCDRTIFYEMSQKYKKIECPAPKENKSNPEISTQPDSDINSLFDILKQKRNTLSENKGKLQTKQAKAAQTEVEYNNFYRECNSLVNKEIKNCEDRELEVRKNFGREIRILMNDVKSDIEEAERQARIRREAIEEDRRLAHWAALRALRESLPPEEPKNRSNTSCQWPGEGKYIDQDGFVVEEL